MAMGRGVGSEAEIANAEGPLGRGEEPIWVMSSGRHARRARRRIRQRVRKRRVLATETGRMEKRVDELERQNRNHIRLITQLCDRFDGVRSRADDWPERMEQFLSEMRVGFEVAAGGCDTLGRLTEQVNGVMGCLLAQASQGEKLGRVQLESLVKQNLLVKQVQELQAEVARLSSASFAQSPGSLTVKALGGKVSSVESVIQKLADERGAVVGRLDGLEKLVEGSRGGLQAFREIQEDQAARLAGLERAVPSRGERATGSGNATAMAQGQNRIAHMEAELADLKGQLVHGSAHAGQLIAGLRAAEVRLGQSVAAVVSDESRTFRRVSDLGVVVKGLMKEVHRIKELWDSIEPEEAD